MIPPHLQVMRIFWKAWTKMTLFFVKWWQQWLPTPMICSIHMKWKIGGGGQYVDPTVGVWYVLGTMWTTSTLFKTLTNFTLEEFYKLVSQVVPTITIHVKSTCEFHLSYFMFSFWFSGLRVRVLGFNFSVKV